MTKFDTVEDVLDFAIAEEIAAKELYDRFAEWAAGAGHLAPALLKQELAGFQKAKGYLPRVVTVHMSPNLEAEIATELAAVAQAQLGRHQLPQQ